MTAAQMSVAIGQKVNWNASKDIKVECEVRDVKQAYGNIRLLIVPVAGIGSQWVDVNSVSRITSPSTQLTAL
jgi:hypothetical protein